MAANSIPEFRQRLQEDRIIEFDHCIPSYTLALEHGSYCYCTIDDRLPFQDYLKDAKQRQEEAKKNQTISDGENADQLLSSPAFPG